MYISRLQLKGFKSFGGKPHDLQLSPGFTAIVGPNGSGKSNLLDALRWSLGETSASRIRISRQSDLLFSGSPTYSKANEAEVLLQLHDEDKICSIRRRVTGKDGATALFVDNVRHTLAGLELVKHQWKLEGTRFAFIGQGEVQEVLSASPAERRQSLESLFGIDIYRKKRMEASDRLELAHDEYDKLRGLYVELLNRREEIKDDVKKALIAKEIADNIEEKRKFLYFAERRRAEETIAKLNEELDQELKNNMGAAFWKKFWAGVSDNVNQKIEDATSGQETQKAELAACRTKFENLTKTGLASAMNLRSANAIIATNGEDLKEAREALQKLLEEQKQAQKSISDAREEAKKAEEELKKAEEAYAQFEEALAGVREAREARATEHGRLDAELDKLRAKLAYLGKELLEAKQEKEKFRETTRHTLDEEIKKLQSERDKITTEQEEINKKHMSLTALCQDLSAKLGVAKRQASSLKADLQDARDNLEQGMYPAPVRFVLSSAKLGRISAKPCALIDAMNVPKELAIALEAYLGGRQFQLFVETIDEARVCIDRLKQKQEGTATFLPLERSRPRTPNRGYPLPKSGIVGFALDLIEIDSKWRPCIEHNLGDLLIVENFETATRLAREGFKSPIVTLEGDVFQPGGTISGGRSKRSGKTLEMKVQVATLEEQFNASYQALQKLADEYKSATAEEAKIAESKEEWTKKVREINGKIAVAEDDLERLEREQKHRQTETNRIMTTLKLEGKNWITTLDNIAQLEAEQDEEVDIPDDKELIENREKARAKAMLAASEISKNFALAERTVREVSTANERIRSLEEEYNEAVTTQASSKSDLARMGKTWLEVFHQKQKVEAIIEKSAKGYKRYERIRLFVAKRVLISQNASQQQNENLNKKRERISHCEQEIVDLTNTWDERFPYDPEVVIEVNLEDLKKQTRDYERKLRGLGEVNMGALSEDESLEKRTAKLGEDLADVEKSAEEIERLITDADMMAYNKFTASLDQVDEKFTYLFKKLFGGGEAHLIMTEGATIWNCGVEVKAQLPGKQSQVLNQYSGGERALISIALLFATMDVAGSPLAVLDEVDAALDEANLKRFSQLTKEYAKERQILAMTHRRVTMEGADVLYGVTLQEPGLSQIVGVKLDDWD